MIDPTRDEMLTYLNAIPFADEFDDFDRERAIYWFAADYHGGQGSNLYLALCQSPYIPGRLERSADEGGSSAMLYEALQAEMLAMRDAGRRRAAALAASRKRREG